MSEPAKKGLEVGEVDTYVGDTEEEVEADPLPRNEEFMAAEYDPSYLREEKKLTYLDFVVFKIMRI